MLFDNSMKGHGPSQIKKHPHICCEDSIMQVRKKVNSRSRLTENGYVWVLLIFCQTQSVDLCIELQMLFGFDCDTYKILADQELQEVFFRNIEPLTDLKTLQFLLTAPSSNGVFVIARKFRNLLDSHKCMNPTLPKYFLLKIKLLIHLLQKQLTRFCF